MNKPTDRMTCSIRDFILADMWSDIDEITEGLSAELDINLVSDSVCCALWSSEERVK